MKLSEKEWTDKYLTGRTWGWQELLRSGRAEMKNLVDGDFKNKLDTFLSIESDIEKDLMKYEYEAG